MKRSEAVKQLKEMGAVYERLDRTNYGWYLNGTMIGKNATEAILYKKNNRSQLAKCLKSAGIQYEYLGQDSGWYQHGRFLGSTAKEAWDKLTTLRPRFNDYDCRSVDHQFQCYEDHLCKAEAMPQYTDSEPENEWLDFFAEAEA